MAINVHRRLRTRILLGSFIPAAIILSAVAVTIYYAYERVTQELVVGKNQQLTHLSASQLAADLNPYVDSLSALARSPDLYSGTRAAQSDALENGTTQLMAFD